MMEQLKWYMLKVVSGQEKKTKAHLEAEVKKRGLEKVVVEILIPSEKIYEMRAGKRKTKEKNFFPGYILMGMTLHSAIVNQVLKDTPGALGLLGQRGWSLTTEPVALRQHEIDRILGRVDEAENGEISLENKFMVGGMVKIIDGPFSGFSGTVQEIFEDRKKLNVTVKIFDRNTPMELGYGQVDRVV